MKTPGQIRREAAARFRRWKNLYYYAHGKMLLDPAYPWIAEELKNSRHPLLDIGCGAGHLTAFLRAAGHAAPITGVDVDVNKIAVAREVLPDCEFLAADARELPAHSGDVVMLDVLHYFEPEVRHQLLAAIANRLGDSGTCHLRVTIRDGSWRFRVTRMEEWFVKASGWIPFASIGFPTRDELEESAAAAGLRFDIRPMWGWTPFNSYLATLTPEGSKA